MRENRLRAIWREGGVALSSILKLPDSYTAEIMAHHGWDSLILDLQHSPISEQATIAMLQAISTTPTVPLVRVAWNDPAAIMRALDAGCYGVICPMINNRAEAEAFVGACRYPPKGYRSYGPHRALLYAGKDYAYHANEQVVALAMIETAQGLANLDEILRVPGLDGVYIGPVDLAQSLTGQPGINPSDPPIMEAIDRILGMTKEAGRVAGIYTGSVSDAKAMMEKGFDLVTLLADAYLLANAAQETLHAVRTDESSAKTRLTKS